ncbi:hypothetical protein B0T36_13600 [Nocardia donostiensis]|uniref:hypothetical protein n=1 Tax=Nocardia donostiensis TaxID=1538463 RepID=UPI0009D9F3AA|nr:hypothetical protein [Nocardia donostiensis]OQS14551.1 hypothetical protein B0T36_13600 [Nocardia donostiensis]
MFAPVSPLDSPSALLADAAFGARPGRSAGELPAARDGLEEWWRAVLLGGQGRYAAARAELRNLRMRSADPVLLALAASTEGSLLRQLGWHDRAARYDGRAAALILPSLERNTFGRSTTAETLPAGVEPQAIPADALPHPVAAAGDALTGLAADALGAGRLELAARLLERAHRILDHHDPSRVRRRLWVRWHWVRAETALAGGRGASALPCAEVALALAEAGSSVRHQVKSRLLVAAAAMATGDVDRAGELADAVADQCREHDLLPLRWACAMLRGGLPGAVSGDTQRDVAYCTAAIAERGGRFRSFGES